MHVVVLLVPLLAFSFREAVRGVRAVSWFVLGFTQVTGQAQFVTDETNEEALTVEATAATYSGNVVRAYMPGTATGNLLLVRNGATPLLHVRSIWHRLVAKLVSVMLL